MRPSEFHQLLRKVTIEFLGCAGDCQWGGEGVVFGVRRFLRNDGGPDRIALNKGDGQQQPAFAQQGHQFCEHFSSSVIVLQGFRYRKKLGSDL